MSDINTLTVDDLRKAVNAIRENSEHDELEREKRSVKDWAKFHTALHNMGKNMDAGELFSIGQTLYQLAQGYVLVMPKRMKDLILEQLTPYDFPQEIYDNLLVSQNITTK